MSDLQVAPGDQASSVDGRTFQVLEMAVKVVPGDLVLLRRPDGGAVLGQLLTRQAGLGATSGGGAIVGAVDDEGRVHPGTTDPFDAAMMKPAPDALLASLQEASAADLRIGSTGAVDAMLRSKAFNRHTFMCGQSGSGKSYALGVLLEQLLIDTDLPLLVLDPNGDYVGLGTAVPTATDDERTRIAAADVHVLRPFQGDEHGLLRVRFTALDIHAKAGVLQLDPLHDREEYHVLIQLERRMETEDPEVVLAELLASTEPGERALAQRIENLGVLGWGVWARHDEAMLEGLDPMPRATVVDLGAFEEPRERLVVSLALLDHVWANRERRQPVLLVIDEAHNVCLADPSDPLGTATTERLIQIANEGRKYGIWLLLCTQRPSRISSAVLAQCDNLVLMRMNSPVDLAQLEGVFGFVPVEMLRAAPFFAQGESLMAGPIMPAPAYVRVRGRRTREGGGDVSVPRRLEA